MRGLVGKWLGNLTLRRIYKNAGKVTGGKAAAGLISLVYIAIATRMLGPHFYGVLVLLHLYTVTVTGVIGISGWHSVIRYGAQDRKAGRTGDLQKLIACMSLCEIASGVLAMVVVVLGVPFAQAKFGWPGWMTPLAMLYCFGGMGSLRYTPTGVLYLYNRFNLIAAHQTVMPIVRLTGATIALIFGGNLVWFICAWLAAGIAEGLVMWGLAAYVLRQEGLLRGVLRWPHGVSHAHAGLWRFIFATKFDLTLSEFSQRITPLTVGWILGPAAAGLYQVAFRATVALAQPGIIVGQTAFPELSRLAAEGNMRGLRSTMLRAAFPIGVAGTVIVAIFYFFGGDILSAFAGVKFRAAADVLVLLGVGRVIQLYGLALNPALLALGKSTTAFAINASITTALFPLLVLFVYALGLDGAGVHAILLASALVAGMAIFVFREIAHIAQNRTPQTPVAQEP